MLDICPDYFLPGMGTVVWQGLDRDQFSHFDGDFRLCHPSQLVGKDFCVHIQKLGYL